MVVVLLVLVMAAFLPFVLMQSSEKDFGLVALLTPVVIGFVIGRAFLAALDDDAQAQWWWIFAGVVGVVTSWAVFLSARRGGQASDS